jgi:hypothetical protein
MISMISVRIRSVFIPVYFYSRGSKVLIVSVSVVLRPRLIVDAPFIPDWW